MSKPRTVRPWHVVASVVAAAMLLYGCGGSGGARDQAPVADTTDTTAADSLAATPDTTDTTAVADTAGADSVGTDTLATDTTAADSLLARQREDRTPRDTVDRPALVDADSLRAFSEGGERLQDLFGNVYVRQDSTRLRSRFARRYLERGEFLFTENVVIFERGDTLYADTVRYDKNRKVGRARGNVRLTDGQVTVRAPRAVYFTNDKRSVFPDSVELVDGDRVLRAESGEYFSEEKRAEFYGNVRLTDPDTYMEADSVTYLRDEEVSKARGNVFIERNPRRRRAAGADTSARTFLFGRFARNEEKQKYSRIEGDALLVRIRTDSTGQPSDTLVVAAKEMEATRLDTLNRLIAVDSVRIWQPDLSATADSAVYDRVEPRAEGEDGLGPYQPERPTDPLLARVIYPAAPDLDSLVAAATREQFGDPARVAPEKGRGDSLQTGTDPVGVDSLDGAGMRPDSLVAGVGRDSVTTAAGTKDSVRADSTAPMREESRLYRSPVTWFENAQVTGDSIRVVVRNRSIDTVYVSGNAFAAQEDTAAGEIQQLSGKTITAIFREDDLRRIVAEPNARAIRFLTDAGGEGNGAARPSGDRIVIYFANGTVKRVSVLGGVQSQYYQAGSVPDPFRLEGFSWTPERRPTRDALLTPRARDRLRLPPKQEGPQPDSLRPDSVRPDSVRPDTTDRAVPDSIASGTAPIDTLTAPPSDVKEDEARRPPDRERGDAPQRPAAPPPAERRNRNEPVRPRSDTTRTRPPTGEEQ